MIIMEELVQHVHEKLYIMAFCSCDPNYSMDAPTLTCFKRSFAKSHLYYSRFFTSFSTHF